MDTLYKVYNTVIWPILRIISADKLIEKLVYFCRYYYAHTEEVCVDNTVATFYPPTIPDKGYKELPVLKDLLSEINENDTFYDVGAAGGWYSCFVANYIPANQIICFEPTRRGRLRLQLNLRLNSENATIRSVGLSNKDSVTELLESETIHLIRGDTIINSEGLPHPTIVKIDVEGAETKVIEGMKTTLSHNDCHTVYVELHNMTERGFKGSKEKVRKQLNECGFSVHTIHTRNGSGWKQPFLG